MVKKYEFEVVMTGCTKKVWAFNVHEAEILAKAEAIKDELDYHVLNVYNLTLYPSR
ncbi:hypothetical protein [Paenibacillus oleatilyticus]|uniref:hypothetical protein n=1 Tax=Paenibacillus oleatilyticus TaxID=2594886 RepID=UPI001C1FCA96|nr:hypothetical protein [Paenibacillus oleatilyticus]MBU7316087.1 hypothetical protein [Paenibacillus oleatilyticus]